MVSGPGRQHAAEDKQKSNCRESSGHLSTCSCRAKVSRLFYSCLSQAETVIGWTFDDWKPEKTIIVRPREIM